MKVSKGASTVQAPLTRMDLLSVWLPGTMRGIVSMVRPERCSFFSGAKALLLHHLDGAAQACMVLVTQSNKTKRMRRSPIG